MSSPPHGTYARYQAGAGSCRCDACRAAARDYQRMYRRRGRDAEVKARLGDCVGGLGWPRYSGKDLSRMAQNDGQGLANNGLGMAREWPVVSSAKDISEAGS